MAMVETLKLKASKYYQDEMELLMSGKLFLDQNELKEHHKRIKDNTIKKYRDEFNMLSEQTYGQTLHKCIEVVYKKVALNNSLYRPKKSHAIGIDLGTTNSCVSYFKPSAENKFNCVIIPNEFGRNTTASVVSIRDDEEVVGDVAKEEMYGYPMNTIMSAKRLIGRRFNDESVQKSLKLWAYEVIENENHNPIIKINVDKEEKLYYPEQISAKVLKKMKDTSENHLGCEVTKAVITVPAYFNDAQKEATKDAAKIAGLEVMRIINEPTAAAIAYRLNWTIDTNTRNVLIYDFGGGTFDVAILTISEGEVKVKAVGGDNHLGGDDFDTNIVKYCMKDFSLKYKKIVSGDERERAISRLRLEAEKCKIKLSSAKKSKVYLRQFYDSQDMDIMLTRENFEQINKPLIQRSIDILMKTLKEAELNTDDIDDIVLVGGSTRIPKIQEDLSGVFGGRSLNHSINPDEAVAVGAAIHAAMLNEKQSVPLGDFKLSDVNPHSLGVALENDEFSPIIPKNTKIPTKYTKLVTTVVDNQVTAMVEIYEGENDLCQCNNLLGKFRVQGIPADKAEAQEIAITFDLTDEGILIATAKIMSTGKQKEMKVVSEKCGLTAGQLEKLIEEVLF